MSPIRHSQGWRVVVGIRDCRETVHFSISANEDIWRFQDFNLTTVFICCCCCWYSRMKLFFGSATTTTNSSREEELNTQISSRSWSVVAAMAHQSFPPWQLYMGCCTGCSFRAGTTTTTSFSLFKRRILLKIHHPTRIKPRLRSFFIINLINFVSKAEES